MRRLIPLLALVLSGCGYAPLNSATHFPASVHTLYVPAFTTRTQAFHTEFAFTQSVVRELNTRTRYRILNKDDASGADATLTGTILSETSSPLTYDSSSGQTSSYLITIMAKVVLTDRSGRVLYENDALPLREQYQSTQDLSAFIQEDSPAVQRLARDFAQALVSNMLESL